MVKVARKIKEVAGAVDNIIKFKKLNKRQVEGGKCMIVEDEGADIMGNVSDVIAPHGCCSGYEANYDKISDTRNDSKRKAKLTTDDVT